ncbi:MAG: sugar O-acetyltransferase [Clostridia bacterium]|nr:sugar O-acetyltransferase [Clostridia bacterium]
MTQYERMINGLIYDTCDKEIMEMQRPYKEKLWQFNQLNPFDGEAKEAYMKEVFAECGDYCCIELPFRATWGGKNVHFGTGIYANYNLTLIDDGNIYVGNRVLFAPNVTVTTANHPLDPTLRRYEMQYNRDVYIGENVWIGAGAVILAGVHIGKNSVIGAGSVVTRDVPESVLAAGTPCRTIREIGELDREYFYRNDKIDWENLSGICEAKSKLPKFQ